MKGFVKLLNTKFAPKAQKVANNQIIITLKNSILAVLPFIFVGSLITLLNIPTNFWNWWPNLSPISSFTFGLVSIFIAFLFPFNMMESLKLKKQRIIAGLSSVALFLMLANPVWDKTSTKITYVFSEWGAGGMFVALVVGLYVSLIMAIFGKFSFFSEDTALPDFVTAWFDSMLPILIVIATGYILVDLLHFNFYQLIVSIFAPLQNSLDTWWGFTIFMFFECFIYSLGISGWVLAGITQPVMFAGIAANAKAIAAGHLATHVFVSEIIYNFMWIGGVGCTLPLVLVMLFVSKSKRLKALGKAFLLPSIFNINEPVIFGTVVWNPYLMIPLWLNGVILPIITAFWFKMGLSVIPHSLMQMWYLPFPILPWLTNQNVGGLILVIVIFFISTLIWLPFVKVYDNQLVKQESEN